MAGQSHLLRVRRNCNCLLVAPVIILRIRVVYGTQNKTCISHRINKDRSVSFEVITPVTFQAITLSGRDLSPPVIGDTHKGLSSNP